MLRGLYAITDSQLTPPGQIEQKVEQALKGGAQLIQYRDKQSPYSQKKRIAANLLKLVNRYQKKLIINDDLELADEIHAHGVHLGQEDTAIAEAREQLGPQAIIGATCHNSLALAQRAITNGASYVAFGRFFTSQTKPEAPLCSLQVLSEAQQILNTPIVAIGGITLSNAPAIIAAGADMVAVVNGVFGVDDIEKQSLALTKLFQ